VILPFDYNEGDDYLMHQRFLRLVVLAATCIANCVSASAQGSKIEEQLKVEYQYKVLTLRHFYEGPKLQFDTKGQIVGDTTIGPWTLDGRININEIHLHDRLLQLRGQRLFLFYDSTAKRMKDAVRITTDDPMSKEFPQFGGVSWQEFEKTADVEIELALASAPKDEKEVVSAINTVFLAPDDALAEFVPAIWQCFVMRQEGNFSACRSGDGVYRVGHDVSPPRVFYAPDPEYSEAARLSKFQGSTTLWLVVTTDGTAQDVKITEPCGLGLDEKAVKAVSVWKFEPGRKDGSPVAVQINVKVTFRLH
jgi:TonB family protein